MKFVKFVQHLNGFFYANLIHKTLIVNELVSFFIFKLHPYGSPEPIIFRKKRTIHKINFFTNIFFLKKKWTK